MLVLSRKAGERIQIGNDVTLTVISVKGNRVRLGIEAPKECRIVRDEILWDNQSVKIEEQELEAELLPC